MSLEFEGSELTETIVKGWCHWIWVSAGCKKFGRKSECVFRKR